MNKKKIWKVLALMLVVVLAFALLTACDKGKKQEPDEEPKPVEDTGSKPDDKVSPIEDRQDAFLETLFKGANEIAPDGSTDIGTEEGKDIGFNIGLTLTLTVDGEEIPVSISAKAFLDRVTEKHEQEIDKKFASLLAERVQQPGATAKEDYDKKKEYPDGTKYFCDWYDIKNTNETVLDVCISSEDMEALGIYYAPKKSMDSVYLTLGGNKYEINLRRFIALDEGDEEGNKWAHGLVYNMCEKLVTSGVINKLADAFKAEGGFDLNKLFSDALNDLLGGFLDEGETLYDKIKDLGGAEGGGVSLDLSGIIFGLFGGEKKAEENLGENINVLGLLKSVKKMALSEPVWEYKKEGAWKTVKTGKNSREYDKYIKDKLAQPLKASAEIDINVAGLNLQEMTILKDGHISLGYEKAEGTDGKIGKLENFWIELMLNNIMGTDQKEHSFGLNILIDDLSFMATKDPSIERDVSGYETSVAVEAEAEINLDDGAFDIYFGNDEADYHATFGHEGLEITDTEIKIPKWVKLNVKGAVDLVASAGTKIVVKMTYAGADKPLATVQLYGKDGEDADEYRLEGDAKIDKAVLDKVTAIVKKMSAGRPMGKDGFAWDETLGKWGFWAGDGEGAGAAYTRKYKSGEDYSLKGVSEALDALLKNGEIHLNKFDPFDAIKNASGKTLFIDYTPANDNEAKAAAEIDTMQWVMDALLNADKETGAITLLANLFSFAAGSLSVGGDNLLADVFNNVLCHMDPDDTDILPSIYSMFGYFGEKLTDVQSAYEYLEKKVYEFNTGYTLGGVGYIRPASSGINSADKLMNEWNAEGTTADRRAEITAELEDKGYAVVATNKAGNAAVHYPMNLFKLVADKAEDEVGKFTSAGQADKDLGDGFVLVELADGAENLKNVTEQTLWNGKIQRRYQIISKTIDELKADYEADKTEESAIILMRRGEVCKVVDGELKDYGGVLIDEQMLSAASLEMTMPEAEDSGDKITNGEINVNAEYDGSKASVKLTLKVIDPSGVKINESLVSAGCKKISLDLH